MVSCAHTQQYAFKTMHIAVLQNNNVFQNLRENRQIVARAPRQLLLHDECDSVARSTPTITSDGDQKSCVHATLSEVTLL